MAKAVPNASRVDPLSSAVTPKCFDSPSIRLARFTVWPSGPYLNRRRLPMLPTRAGPVFSPRPSPSGTPSVCCHVVVQPGQFVEHRQRRAAGQHGMIGLRRRRVPHRQQTIADVIHHDAAMFDDPPGEPFHHVAHQLAGFGRRRAVLSGTKNRGCR